MACVVDVTECILRRTVGRGLFDANKNNGWMGRRMHTCDVDTLRPLTLIDACTSVSPVRCLDTVVHTRVRNKCVYYV